MGRRDQDLGREAKLSAVGRVRQSATLHLRRRELRNYGNDGDGAFNGRHASRPSSLSSASPGANQPARPVLEVSAIRLGAIVNADGNLRAWLNVPLVPRNARRKCRQPLILCAPLLHCEACDLMRPQLGKLPLIPAMTLDLRRIC